MGTYHLGLAVSAAEIGAVSVAMSLAGLELGARIRTRAGRYSEYLSGTILILAGAAIAAGLISNPHPPRTARPPAHLPVTGIRHPR